MGRGLGMQTETAPPLTPQVAAGVSFGLNATAPRSARQPWTPEDTRGVPLSTCTKTCQACLSCHLPQTFLIFLNFFSLASVCAENSWQSGLQLASNAPLV